MKTKEINLPEIIGKGYGKFWKDTTHRYVICKGSRSSKKSKTTALWIIYHMMKYPLSNALVVRQVYNTHRDSTYSDLQWAVNRLKVSHLWKFSKSSLWVEYMPTGQRIMFRGCDNAMSITSISVPKGVLNICWFEEFFQINEDDFNKIDMSIRGELPPGYFFRIIGTFNPWSDKHFSKKRFFDDPDEMTYSFTTNYMVNEWNGPETIKLFENMKKRNPRRYRIEGLGEWGISEGLVYDNWEVSNFNLKDIPNSQDFILCYGADFGFNDPTTILSIAVDEENKYIYIYSELYKKYMTPDDIEKMIKDNNLQKCRIIADCSRPEIISQLNRKGCNVVACKKGKDSILTGIQFIQDYKIIVHPSCTHVQEELSLYCWDKDKLGNKLDKPEDTNNHTLDALRYSLEPIMKPKQKSRVRSW